MDANTRVRNGSIIAASPYAVTSSDGLGIRIIACTLNGENYLTWSRLMTNALRAKNKLGFIDGSIRKPAEGDANELQWIMCNSMVVAWITNTLDQDLQSSVACIENEKNLWDDLKERFLEEGESVAKYYSNLKVLWDELENFLEAPTCTCAAVASITSQREKEKAYQFLMGLNSEFGMVRSNILSLDTLHSLNKIYYMVIHEERQKIVAHGHESGPEAVVYYVKEGHGTNQLDTHSRGRPHCDYCDRMGHTRNTCWKLHGKPADWEPKSKGKGGPKQQKKFEPTRATGLGVLQARSNAVQTNT
ncbi:hypothetical protein CRG98_014149 [Punica granatum]|uniref:Retrotransposon Copia-like N-terminal domain-containing protein n=1 Tax=Punica granatum TaxID=22663 RepID=A0A2I0KB34_PUNGR|nr:hypothetical protein CRG98_014149 [Punica granatum]